MLFKKKNQQEQAEAPPIASMSASPGNQKQSLFAPSLNPTPAHIDFGFGNGQESPASAPAYPEPVLPSQSGGWASSMPTDAQPGGWASSSPPLPEDPSFSTGGGWAATAPPPMETTAAMPMPATDTFSEPGWASGEPTPLPAMSWEDSSPAPMPEPTQPYLTETFDNYTPDHFTPDSYPAPGLLEPLPVTDLPAWEPVPMAFEQPDSLLPPEASGAFEPSAFNDLQATDLQSQWEAPSTLPMPGDSLTEMPGAMYTPEPAYAPMETYEPPGAAYAPAQAEHSLWNNLDTPELSMPGEQMPIDPAAFLDSVGEQLYPQDPFSSPGSDLEESAQAFEEAAQFLFPETMGAPLEWSPETSVDLYEPDTSLSGTTMFEPAMELGPSFQNETAGFDDISVFDAAPETASYERFETLSNPAAYTAPAPEPAWSAEPAYQMPPMEPIPQQPSVTGAEPSFAFDTDDAINLDDDFGAPPIMHLDASGSVPPASYEPAHPAAPIHYPDMTEESAWEAEENGLSSTAPDDLKDDLTPGMILPTDAAVSGLYEIPSPTEAATFSPPVNPPPFPEPALDFSSSFEDDFGEDAPATELLSFETPSQPIATWDETLESALLGEQPSITINEPPDGSWFDAAPLSEPTNAVMELVSPTFANPAEASWGETQIQDRRQTASSMQPPYAEPIVPESPTDALPDEDFYAVSFTLNAQGELVPDHGEGPALPPELPGMPPASQTPAAPVEENNIAPLPEFPMEPAELRFESLADEESISAFEFLNEPETELSPAYALDAPMPAMAMESAPILQQAPAEPPEAILPPPVSPVEPVALAATQVPSNIIRPKVQPGGFRSDISTKPSPIAPHPVEDQWEQAPSKPVPPKPSNSQATNDLMTGNLEIISICPLDAEKRLLIIHNGGIFALMGQCGAEQPEISVLKVFDNNPIAYQNTFTAVAEGQAGNQGMYVVQVGIWHAIVSTFQNKISLHTELG